MHNSILSIEQASVSYGRPPNIIQALDNVSCSFEQGDLNLVLGPSGSGKTTLLAVLGCLLTPNSGRVRVMGEVVSHLSTEKAGEVRRKSIGYIFQAFRLFRSLNALENVLITLEISDYKVENAKDLALECLRSVGLADKWYVKPHELSGGEKQRVAIARVLVKNPPIILADEPTASLDSASGEVIAKMLYRLAEEDNRLVVVVSHDPLWLRFCHRKVALRDGKLVDGELTLG